MMHMKVSTLYYNTCKNLQNQEYKLSYLEKNQLNFMSQSLTQWYLRLTKHLGFGTRIGSCVLKITSLLCILVDTNNTQQYIGTQLHSQIIVVQLLSLHTDIGCINGIHKLYEKVFYTHNNSQHCVIIGQISHTYDRILLFRHKNSSSIDIQIDYK